jgi:hypothetical protein
VAIREELSFPIHRIRAPPTFKHSRRGLFGTIDHGGSDLSEITERKAIDRARNLASWAAAALLVGSAAASLSGSVTQAAAASSIGVFVGYADSDRAGGEFPNPWNGAPNVTFDGCSPQSSCTFDAGAVRIRNNSTAAVSIAQVSVHIGACVYTWSGSLYPVTLAPGASLVTTQRGSGVANGCTGPNPSTFDSSDIPHTGICTNDGIQPTIDVTVDGTTSSYTDSGQVLNSGGVDPGACSNSDESTDWVKIGNKACPGQTLSLNPVSQTDPIDTTATVTATLTDACGGSLSDVVVGFKIASGPNAGATGSGVTDTGGNATFSYSSTAIGTDSLQAAVTNAVGFTRTSNTATVTWIVQFAPGGGGFVIGDGSAALGSGVYFWGAQWAWRNTLSGGLAPRSFKGFADVPAAPACGQRWTSDPGNSTPPPDGPLPELMGVIVTSAAHQSGPEISGDIVAIVVVRTKPGYAPNPGHPATGTVVAVICGAVAPSTGAPQHPQRPVPTPGHASGASAGGGGGGASTTAAACCVPARGRSVSLPPQACPRAKRP